ncbi:hypothetical protein FRC03_010055 [Tulasnella sp. 419]|nr:hypothetical protein FRC03_010055 [Tulasnella sp. 419]
MAEAAVFAKFNEEYAKEVDENRPLSLPPNRKLAVLTCMDARIDPAAILGLKEGDAHVIRNAGGRATDALRSLIISQHLLGTREISVIHHTDCGMVTFSDETLRRQLRESVPANLAPSQGPSIDASSFLPFKDLENSVREDVAFLQASPLLVEASKANITGWIYDVKTKKLSPVH